MSDNLIYEPKYLTDESQIVDYFMDCGQESFECGQGYFQDEASVFVRIKDDYFIVTIHAEIFSSKQDVGDRLYYVESITDVRYDPISEQEYKDRTNMGIINQIELLKKKIKKLETQLI